MVWGELSDECLPHVHKPQIPSSELHKEQKGKVALSYTEAAGGNGYQSKGTWALLFLIVCLRMQSPRPFLAVMTLQMVIAFITYVEHMYLWLRIT